MNDRNITNARFIQVNQLPQIDSHLTSKLYVDNAKSDGVKEQSLLGLDPDKKVKPDEQDLIILISSLTSPKTIIEIPTENYVDKKFIVPSIMRITTHVDFTDKNLDNIRFIKVNNTPAVEEHVTPKFMPIELYLTIYHMLMDYVKSIEIDKTYHQCLMIKY